MWRDPRLGRPGEVRLLGGIVRYHDAGAGPVLLFVHGYLVNANLWRQLVPLLAKDFRCITPDWPLGSHTVPMDADLSPPGIAALIDAVATELGLTDVTLVGNDSGGAYGQLVAAHRPVWLSRLVLNTCETPWCSWPPGPGGFGLLKAAARWPATHWALYQALRPRWTWRWPNTYGWLAKYPVEERVMRSYVRPVLTDPAIRADGRRAIGSVSAGHVATAGERLAGSGLPVLLAWASEDHVFPLSHAERYAERLDADLHTIADSYTYTAEDQPARTAEVIGAWLAGKAGPTA